jgi:hypothetical protein
MKFHLEAAKGLFFPSSIGAGRAGLLAHSPRHINLSDGVRG